MICAPVKWFSSVVRHSNGFQVLCAISKFVVRQSYCFLNHYVADDRQVPPAYGRYHLQGMVVHCGCDLHSGHYYCFQLVSDKWYLFDDARVRLAEWRAVQGIARGDHQGHCPTLLFYARADYANREEHALARKPAPDTREGDSARPAKRRLVFVDNLPGAPPSPTSHQPRVDKLSRQKTARQRRHLLAQRAARRSRGAKLLAPTTHGHQGSGPGTVEGAPPGVERSKRVVDGQSGSRRTDNNVDMMEVDGDRAMQEAPGSARVAVDFGHASGARAAAPLGADAAATTGGARGDDTCGLSRLGRGTCGRASADGHGGAGGAGPWGSRSIRGVGAGGSTPRGDTGAARAECPAAPGIVASDSHPPDAGTPSGNANVDMMDSGGDRHMAEDPAEDAALAATAARPSVTPGPDGMGGRRVYTPAQLAKRRQSQRDAQRRRRENKPAAPSAT